MNFNFSEVLTRAWQIIWKHKILWVFGILAGCGRGGGGNSGNTSSWSENGGNLGQGDLPPQVLRWLQNIQENLNMYIALFVAVVCIIWILTVFLSTIGKIGLIRGTAQADGGVESLIFGQLFSESMPYFWRIFALSLLLGLPVLFIGVILAVVLVGGVIASGGGESAGFAALGMLPVFAICFCVLIPMMFVAGMIFRQAENAVVLEEMNVLPAISRGWEVFRGNLGPIFVMAIILAILGFVTGLIIAIPVIVVVFPAVLTFAMGQGQSYSPLIFMGVCLCIYIPVAMVLQGIISAYTESAWTLTYMRITKPQDNTPVGLEEND